MRQRRSLPLLLLVADASCFGLQITNLTKVKPHGSSTKGVGFRLASVFFEGGAEAADEGVEASPRLAQRAGAGSWRVWMAVKGADWGVDFGLAKLVKVPEEFENVSPTAPGERERRAVVLEVLSEGVPVTPLLVLVAAAGTRR